MVFNGASELTATGRLGGNEHRAMFLGLHTSPIVIPIFLFAPLS
jgi:hypothetical protein